MLLTVIPLDFVGFDWIACQAAFILNFEIQAWDHAHKVMIRFLRMAALKRQHAGLGGFRDSSA